MKPFVRALFLTGVLGCMILAHIFIRHDTASIFLAPAGKSILLASITPAPVVLLIIIALIFELMSTLPFGTILAVFAIPFIVQWALRFPETDFSWKFFFMTTLSVILQIAFLVAVKNIFHPLSIYEFPFGIISMQIICTSIFTYGIAAFYHEFSSRV